MLLFYARKRADFSETTAPDWVTAWLSKRAEKEEKIANPVEKPINEAVKAKRQQARQQKVEDGIEELRLWLKDIIRNGILGMVDKGFAWFENMAWRMVDAQAGGLATMVRNLGGTNFYAESWQSRFMTQLLSIYVVIEGYKNNKSLDNLLQQDIRSLIGFTQNQDELKEQSGISDNWLALCKQNLDIDHITTERNWLCGIETKRYALVL